MQCNSLHQPMDWSGSGVEQCNLSNGTLPAEKRELSTLQTPVLCRTPWPNTWPRPLNNNEPDELPSLKEENIFPFQYLPEDIRLRIFSYLKPTEKARCRRVCENWQQLLSKSILWQHLNFQCVPLCLNTRLHHRCSPLCYSKYCKRVKEFVKFLVSISERNSRVNRLKICSLEFSFDIREPAVEWRRMIERLLSHCDTTRLVHANINWKDTYFPLLCRGYEPPNDRHYWHRLRQRIFLGFFDSFVEHCTQLTTLLMPFEWSEKSIVLLSRLTKLDTLVLHRYFDFSAPSQECVEQLLAAVPGLLRLMLEIWCYSDQAYSLTHSNLQYLDVSHCRGLSIRDLNMPKLRCFKITRSRWSGVVFGDFTSQTCLFNVLREGARSLRQLNELTLVRGWYKKHSPYPQLDQLLYQICACTTHTQTEVAL